MNLKRAKRIRHELKQVGIDPHQTEYAPLCPLFAGPLDTPPWPRGAMMFSGHVQMTGHCGRYLYQQMKRQP